MPGNVVYEAATYDTRYVSWAFYDEGRCTLTQLVDGVTATYDACGYTVDVERETIAIVLLSQTWSGEVARGRMTLTDPQNVVWELRPQ